MAEREPDATFETSTHTVCLTGRSELVHQVEVVVDDDFTEAERRAILEQFESSLAVIHPRLRAAIRRIVVPDMHDPSNSGAAPAHSSASAHPASGQLCVWSNRRHLSSPSMLPDAHPLIIEHECAHLLFPTAGPPDNDEWNEAIELDGPDRTRGRFVTRQVELYPKAQQLREDWASSVAYMLLEDRDKPSNAVTTAFRYRYKHRAAVIDRILGDGQ